MTVLGVRVFAENITEARRIIAEEWSPLYLIERGIRGTSALDIVHVGPRGEGR